MVHQNDHHVKLFEESVVGVLKRSWKRIFLRENTIDPATKRVLLLRPV